MGFMGLQKYSSQLFADQEYRNEVEGYGELIQDPDHVIDLPRGFRYKVVSRSGDFMNDGLRIPGAPDGMAAFPARNGRVLLVRNHEMSRDSVYGSPFDLGSKLISKIDRSKLYDLSDDNLPHIGGTTTVLYDPPTGRVVRQFLSLSGTCRNCAGGPTPWQSWITCEETTMKAGNGNLKDHGYNFEVPATQRITLNDAVPLKAMGRFQHEAVAVEPKSGIVYQTEDVGNGLIYRFIPNEPGKLHRGGRLQALAIRDWESCDTRNWIEPNKDGQAGKSKTLFALNMPYEVEWIDLDNVESPENDLRVRGHAAGAAVFSRGEGMWYGNASIYWACTDGGAIKKGQIFKYIPSPYEGTKEEANYPGKLELFIESTSESLLEYCDTLTVAPWGDLVIAEDGPREEFLRVVTPSGKLFTLARNRINNSEFAGPCFAPNHPTLFVNIQNPGITLAITGPWNKTLS